jgi:SAM-dependent methyltransferase
MHEDRDNPNEDNPSEPAAPDDRIGAIRAHYEPRMLPQRPSHEVLDWASAASQEARFEVLYREVPLAGRSLLDVGCGLGDLAGFLRRRNLTVDYTGVDLLARMIESCRQRFPDGRFLQADIFNDDQFPPNSFDVVFTSGIFNLDLGNNLAFLPVAVRRLLALSRRHTVFNLLHARSPQKQAGYFFYDPNAVLSFLAGEHCEIRIIDDYLPNDFTVICRKR